MSFRKERVGMVVSTDFGSVKTNNYQKPQTITV